MISVSFDPSDGTLSVTDKRTAQPWHQKAVAQGKIGDVACEGRKIEAVWQDARTGLKVQMNLQVEPDKPEFTVSLSAQGDLKTIAALPASLCHRAGHLLGRPHERRHLLPRG